MKPRAERFEDTVLKGWEKYLSDAAGFDEAASLRWSPDPGIDLQALYPSDLSGPQPEAVSIAAVAEWTVVARVQPGASDAEWLRLETEGVEPVTGAIFEAAAPRPSFVPHLLQRGLTCFLDGFGTARHSSWDGEASSGCVLLDDPLARFLVGAGDQAFARSSEVTLDGRYFDRHRSVVVEAALGAAVLSEYLSSGNRPERVRVLIPGSHKLLLTVARARAVRLLMRRVLGAYSADGLPVEVWGLLESGCDCEDRAVHQIRTTLAAVGAILGSCDHVVSEPFARPSERSEDAARLAVNALRILRLESHLGETRDPLSGAAYVEAMTRQTVTRAWKLFLAIEDDGGIVAATEGDALSHILNSFSGGADDAQA